MSLPTPVNFRMAEAHMDDSSIELNPDQQGASLDKLQKAYTALTFLHECIKDNKLSVSTRYNALGVAIRTLQDLNTLLGGDNSKKEEIDILHDNLRSANTEIQRLREEMSQGVSVEAIGLKLKPLEDTVYKWWKTLGFSYSSGHFVARFDGAVYKVMLSGLIGKHLDMIDEDCPVTGEARRLEKIKSLTKKTDVLEKNNDCYFLATPKNIRFLQNKLAKRFTGIHIIGFRTFVCEGDKFFIREVEASIPIQSI